MSDKVWLTLMRIGQTAGCHQLNDRSFSCKNYQFPLCARCTGVLIGQLIMLIQLFFVQPILLICLAGSGLMLIDWLLQYFKLLKSNNIRRLITGILGGYGLIGLGWLFFVAILKYL